MVNLIWVRETKRRVTYPPSPEVDPHRLAGTREIMESAVSNSMPLRPFMEHRWGVRCKMNLPVLIKTGYGPATEATLCNASISGALLRCDGTRLRTPVEVIFPVTRSGAKPLRLTAWPVRCEAGTIAVEWDEMASPTLRELLGDLDTGIVFDRDRAFG